VLRRLSTLTGAAVLGAAALIGLTAGTAHAEPACPDVHWIGAAGSGERETADLTAYSGMGRPVYQSLLDLQRLLQQDGRTITAEAVEYPAKDVPEDGGLLDWAAYMSSVDAGTAALGAQYASFTERCPASKVVLAGYSQGAMVVHRNLTALAQSPNLAVALLIADGDRLPDDTAISMDSTGSITPVSAKSKTKGAAQDWPILAHTPGKLPEAIGSRTISVCDRGDAVCDYDPDAKKVSPVAVAIHKSYALTTSGGYAWTLPLYALLGPAPTVSQAQPLSVASSSAPGS
jgi:hypothetical protein